MSKKVVFFFADALTRGMIWGPKNTNKNKDKTKKEKMKIKIEVINK